MLKKALVIGAIAGLGFAASPANAAIFCATVDVTVNDTNVAQEVCTPA